MALSNTAVESKSMLNQEESSETLSGILGTGSALPEKPVTNDELSTFLETSDEWIQERVGVRSRHIAQPHESTVSLSAQAGARAIEMAGINPDEIDLIILGTVTPDRSLPSSASLIQHKLGIKHAMSFDVVAACSGFLYGLAVADGLQRAGVSKKALVIGAETLSRALDWTDRRTCVLFGDGAGAVVYSRGDSENGSESSGIIAADLHCSGELNHLICRPGGAFPKATLPESIRQSKEDTETPYICMNGREVFKVGVNAMYSSMKVVLEESGTSIEDISLLVPHQSNQRMIDSACEKIGLKDRSRLAFNLDRVGNTSAASIPIAFDESVRKGQVKRGELVLMTAVGAGITYGSVLFRF